MSDNQEKITLRVHSSDNNCFTTGKEFQVHYTVDGDRAVMFKGYWRIVTDRNTINLDATPLEPSKILKQGISKPALKSVSTPFSMTHGKIKTSRITDAQKSHARRRINTTTLQTQHLKKLAFWGFERALVELSQRNGARAREAYRVSLAFRPRYKDLQSLSRHQANAYKMAFGDTAKAILPLPFKFFLQPIGIGHFKNLYKGLDRTLSAQDVIDMLNKNKETPEIFHIRNFAQQAAASILFHSETYKSYQKPSLEHQTLPGFLKATELEQFFWNHSELLSELKRDNSKILNYDENLSLALQRVSIRIKPKIRGWKSDSYEKFLNLAAALPRHLKLTNKSIKITECGYPQICNALSIYVLFNLMPSQHLRKKFAILHQSGLRHVGDLVVFHPQIRSMLFN